MGKMINFAHVNEHADFPTLLSHYGLEFTQNGDQIRLRCPFHEDTKPSMSITLTETPNAKANTFHCFGCNEKGSVLDFVAEMEGRGDLRGIAEMIDGITGCGLAPPRRQSKRSGKGSKRAGETRGSAKPQKRQSGAEKAETGNSGAPERVSEANQPLKFALPLDFEHPSILSRLNQEAAEYFGVGWLTDKSRSMMSGRICIPIHNRQGELIAYAGRLVEQEVPGDEDKYLFPPKFNKMAELFNFHRLETQREVVIVEGFFGAMRLHQLGAPVVALMGTAISERQIELLRDHDPERIWLLLDGDVGGLKARSTMLEALADEFFVRTVTLPDGGSPDDVPEDVLSRHLPLVLRNRF